LLQHVKTRHAFLVRAGLFDSSKGKDGERNPNARLDQIIDTTDNSFCAKFAKLEVDEYSTFCKLFDKELKVVEGASDQD
jgi:hypothetical protein